ncbi:MAG: hypothetical protein V1733_04010 [bacterium]
MASIFNTSKLSNGTWEWTITAKIGDMLEKAESKYGKRDPAFTFLGVELSNVGNPYIWLYGADKKKFIIRINERCLNDMNFAIFHVSQEIIHFLSPCENANVLEEGLATHFGNEYYKNCGLTGWNIIDKNYLDALKLVEQLFAIDPEIMLKLRKTHLSISSITKEIIISTNSIIPECLAYELTKQF